MLHYLRDWTDLLLYKSSSIISVNSSTTLTRPDQALETIHQSDPILYYLVTVRHGIAGRKALILKLGKKSCQKVGQQGEEGWFVDLHFSLCSLWSWPRWLSCTCSLAGPVSAVAYKYLACLHGQVTSILSSTLRCKAFTLRSLQAEILLTLYYMLSAVNQQHSRTTLFVLHLKRVIKTQNPLWNVSVKNYNEPNKRNNWLCDIPDNFCLICSCKDSKNPFKF